MDYLIIAPQPPRKENWEADFGCIRHRAGDAAHGGRKFGLHSLFVFGIRQVLNLEQFGFQVALVRKSLPSRSAKPKATIKRCLKRPTLLQIFLSEMWTGLVSGQIYIDEINYSKTFENSFRQVSSPASGVIRDVLSPLDGISRLFFSCQICTLDFEKANVGFLDVQRIALASTKGVQGARSRLLYRRAGT